MPPQRRTLFVTGLLIRPHSSHLHLDNFHRVVAEDVHHLDRKLAPTRRAFVEYTDQLQRAVFFGAKRLPLVLEDVISGPHLFPLAAFSVLDPDDLTLVFKIKIDRPVIDPVRPMLGQYLALEDAILVLVHFHDPAFFDYILYCLCPSSWSRRF